MKKGIFCILFILLSSILRGESVGNTSLQQKADLFVASGMPEKREPIIPKDPLTAGFFSMQMPGLGQFYCKRYLCGLTYLTSEIGCFLLAGSIAGLEPKIYVGEDGELSQSVIINKWDDLSGIGKGAVISLILGGVGIHIWNVADAYYSAQEPNKRLWWMNNIDVKLDFKCDNPSLKLTFSRKF